MAFVYRSQNQQEINLKTPGPGKYKLNTQLYNTNINQSSVPFNVSFKRNLWKQNINPGPGTYQINSNICHEQIITHNQEDKFIIYEQPQNTMQFKSNCYRFIHQQQQFNTPGPGSYNVKQFHNNNRKKNCSITFNKNSKLQKFLKNKNQNLQSNIEQLQSILVKEEKKKQQKVQKIKENMIFASKITRNNKTRPITSVGPGSYNITLSTLNSHNILPINKEQNNRMNSRILKCAENIKNQSQTRQFRNTIQDFLQKKPLSKCIQCFGSKDTRFKDPKSYENMPGPWSYQTQIKKSNQTKIVQHFNCSLFHKYQLKSQKLENNVSPVSYQLKNDFSSLLKPKYKKPQIGSFGSKEERFKSKEIKNQSQQDRNQVIINNNKKQNTKKRRKVLKKPQKRVIKSGSLDKTIKMKPLCYDTESNTISHKYKQKIQKDAPFMSRSNRFTVQDPFIDIIADLGNVEQKQNQYNRPQTSINSSMNCAVSMKSKQLRFKKDKTSNVGPQSYNIQKVQKKSFNNLFQ